jgi:hypothetical protein
MPTRSNADDLPAPSRNGRLRSRAFVPLAVIVGLAVMVTARPAAAQRGEDFAPTEALATSPNPNEGFPGLTDTEMAPKGRWVANLPITILDYGFTPRLTAGIAVASVGTVLVGPPGAAVHARYLLGGSRWFRSTLDAFMLSVGDIDSDSATRFRLELFTSNTELLLSPRHRLIAHGWLLHGDVLDTDTPPRRGTALLAGATYSVSLSDRLAVHATCLYLASLTGVVDLPGTTRDIDTSNAFGFFDRLVLRATISLRRGRWLFDLGGLRAVDSFVPWLNVAVQI